MTVPPLSHTRAAARGDCPESGPEGLELLVLELALSCLESAGLGHALMSLQEVVDEREALAAEALAAAREPGAGADAVREAAAAAASFAKAERAEFAAATRWATHVVESRELARRALTVVTASSSERFRRAPGSAG